MQQRIAAKCYPLVIHLQSDSSYYRYSWFIYIYGCQTAEIIEILFDALPELFSFANDHGNYEMHEMTCKH